MPVRTVVFIMLALLIGFPVWAEKKFTLERVNTVLFQCPPCGCSMDWDSVIHAGSCSDCGMSTIPVTSRTNDKIAKTFSPWFHDRALGLIYTKLIYPVFIMSWIIAMILMVLKIRGESLNIYLNGIILVLALYGFKNQITGIHHGMVNDPGALFLPLSFIMLLGPLIYFYTRSMLFKGFTWTNTHFLHLTPALLFLVYYGFLYLNPQLHNRFMSSPYEVKFSHLEQLLAVCSGAGYLAASFIMVLRAQNARPRIKGGWPQRFLWLMSILIVSWGGLIGFNYFYYDLGIATLTYNPLWVIIAFVLLWFGVEIVSRLQFAKMNRLAPASNGYYMNREELAESRKKLDHVMKEDRLYRDPQLNLDKLASRIGLNPRQLSAFINNELQMGFYDLINQYRIQEVQKLLLDPDYGNLTIEGIAQEAGFKSKSSFNASFKKITCKTPRQYIKEHRSKIETSKQG